MKFLKKISQTDVCHSWVHESIPSRFCRKMSPRSKRHSALAATELTARITIDSSWSAAQMENRLALLFHKQFKEETGQSFSFTYLQVCDGCTSWCFNYSVRMKISILQRLIFSFWWFVLFQSVPGSRVLFVPNTPEEGWTGEQVLRICGHGALYILSHHSILQVLHQTFKVSFLSSTF